MPHKTVEPDQAYRLLYPTVVTVITSSWGALDDATPATSCTPLSFLPPLFGVSISPENFVHHLIQRSSSFAINLISRKDIRAASKIGDVSRRFNSQKVKDSGFTFKNARKLDLKVIGEAYAVIECSVERVIPTGDHDLFVGRSETAYAREDFRKYWKYRRYSPILYSGSTSKGTKHRFSRLSTRIIEIPYIQDTSKEEYLRKTLRIVMGIPENQELDRPSAVKLISKALNLQLSDSKYLIDQLIKKKRVSFPFRSKTSY